MSMRDYIFSFGTGAALAVPLSIIFRMGATPPESLGYTATALTMAIGGVGMALAAGNKGELSAKPASAVAGLVTGALALCLAASPYSTSPGEAAALPSDRHVTAAVVPSGRAATATLTV